MAVVGVALAVLGAVMGAVAGRPAARGRYAVDVRVEPAAARIVVDGTAVGTGAWRGAFEADGRAHQLRVEAEGYVAEDVRFVNAAPPPVVQLRRRVVRAVVVPVVVDAGVGAGATVVAPTVGTPTTAVRAHERRAPRGGRGGARRDSCVGPNGENFCL